MNGGVTVLKRRSTRKNHVIRERGYTRYQTLLYKIAEDDQNGKSRYFKMMLE
jgi:hypothetical protein